MWGEETRSGIEDWTDWLLLAELREMRLARSTPGCRRRIREIEVYSFREEAIVICVVSNSA